MKYATFAIAVLAVAIVTAGCSATQHAADVRGAAAADRVTVGTVQREVNLGMSAADVATVLGSPNIVTADQDRHETWIYDKISSEVAYSRSSGAIVGLVFGGSAAGGAGVSGSAGATASSQRTLTVIIRFDENSLVNNFTYHTSRF